MADISKIKLPNGTTYDIKDTNARDRIEVLENTSTNVTVTPIATTGTNIADIEVDGTTYQLFAPEGGGGSGSGSAYTADLLFENTDFSVASGTGYVNHDYTMSANIDDYDAIVVSAYLVNKETTREQAETIIVNKSQYYTRAVSSGTEDYNTRWAFLLNGNYLLSGQGIVRNFCFGFADNTTMKTLARRSNSGEEPKLYRVYGLKFGGGTAYTETTLFRGAAVASTDTPLSDDIRNYDALVVYAEFSTVQATGDTHCTTLFLNTNEITVGLQASTLNYFMGFEYSSAHYQWLRFGFTSTRTLNIFDYRSSDYTITKVIGLKFGGGEAIETALVYSNEERVVGVWTDNRPLYQKTYTYSFTAESNDHDYDIVTLPNEVKVQSIETDAVYRDGIIFKEVVYPPTDSFYRYAVNNNVLNVRIFSAINTTVEGTVTLRYTKTTDTPGSGPYVTSGYCTNHYSTEEQVVGTWINNTPLYQKTLTLTSPSEAFQGLEIADLTSLNIENLVKVEGFLYSETYNQTLPIYWSYAVNSTEFRNSNFGTVYYENNSLKQNISSTAYTNCPLTITIQYTKTIDTPGNNPSVVTFSSTHNYSTDEQVVGTWIDGSTMYERVYVLDSAVEIPSGQWYTTSMPANNINIMVDVTAINTDGTIWKYLAASVANSNYVRLFQTRGDNIGVKTIILRYTKTS